MCKIGAHTHMGDLLPPDFDGHNANHSFTSDQTEKQPTLLIQGHPKEYHVRDLSTAQSTAMLSVNVSHTTDLTHTSSSTAML